VLAEIIDFFRRRPSAVGMPGATFPLAPTPAIKGGISRVASHPRPEGDRPEPAAPVGSRCAAMPLQPVARED
jgi:hypothetical protein